MTAAFAEQLAFAYARTADGLLVREPGRELVVYRSARPWSRDRQGASLPSRPSPETLPDGRDSAASPGAPPVVGVAGVIPYGRTALIPGGPLAADLDVPLLIHTVGRWCDARRLAPLWLNVTAAELPALRAAGFGPTKTAEECVVRHPGRWAGGAYRGVRASCGRATRRGVRVDEVVACDLPPVRRAMLAADLRRVARRHLAAKPQRRAVTGFAAPVPDGRCGPRRLWVARAGGAAVGYATAHPLGVWEEGRRRWTLGGFQTDPAAPAGAATLLIRTVLDDLAAGGVASVSLGPAPALRCGGATEGENPHVRRVVALWFRRLNGVFDARGLWQFKRQFRPESEPLHACGEPRVTVRQAADFVRASGVLRCDPAAVARGTMRDRRRPRTFGAPPRS